MGMPMPFVRAAREAGRSYVTGSVTGFVMDGGNCGVMALWAALQKRPIAACFGHAMRWTVPTRNR
jgi:hypothetical protein